MTKARDLADVTNGRNIVQIVTGNRTSSFSSSARDADTFVFEASITPTSASNKILVFADITGLDNGGSGRLISQIKYDTTSGVNSGTSLGYIQLANDSSGTNGISSWSGTYSTSTINSTSTQYFKLIVQKGDTTTTWYISRFDSISTIVLMEVTP